MSSDIRRIKVEEQQVIVDAVSSQAVRSQEHKRVPRHRPRRRPARQHPRPARLQYGRGVGIDRRADGGDRA